MILRRRLQLVQVRVHLQGHVMLAVVEVAVREPQISMDPSGNGVRLFLELKKGNCTNEVSFLNKSCQRWNLVRSLFLLKLLAPLELG